MCGVPYHAAEIYIQRLLRRGYRIALCEQMEDPKTVKGIVRREVTRVLTPGTAVDPGIGAGESCWLASLAMLKAGVGLAMIDLSTGEFRATEFGGEGAWAAMIDELGRLRPVELVYGQGGLGWGKPLLPAQRDGAAMPGASGGEAPGDAGGLEASGLEVSGLETGGLEAIRTKTAVEDWVMTAEHALPLLRQQFRVLSLDGLGLNGHEAAGVAAGALVHYLRQTKQGALEHVAPVALL